MTDRPNLLLILLDSLRADHLPLYGYSKPTAPTLSRLAEEACVYEQAIADGGWTPASVGALFTGLCGREHNCEERARLPEGIPTLAEVLQAAGYHTSAFSTNPYMLPVHGYGRGFTHFEEVRHGKGEIRALRWLTKPLHLTDKGGRQLTQTFLDALPNLPQPFLSVLHYDETHCPYGARQPYTFRFANRGRARLGQIATALRAHRMYDFMAKASAADYEVLCGLYDGMIAYQDSLLAQILDSPAYGAVKDNTVVVVLADHGDLFGEDGYLGHSFGVNEGLIHVPLVIRAPGVLEPGTRAQGMVQLRDLGRSLASLAGAPPLDESSAPTVDVFGAMAPEDGHQVTFSERRGISQERIDREKRHQPAFDFDRHNVQIACARERRWKLVRNGRGERRLYDLAADPREERNLVDQHPQEAQRLEEKLEEWLSGQAFYGFFPEDEGPVAPEVEQRLRDLGYMG